MTQEALQRVVAEAIEAAGISGTEKQAFEVQELSAQLGTLSRRFDQLLSSMTQLLGSRGMKEATTTTDVPRIPQALAGVSGGLLEAVGIPGLPVRSETPSAAEELLGIARRFKEPPWP